MYHYPKGTLLCICSKLKYQSPKIVLPFQFLFSCSYMTCLINYSKHFLIIIILYIMSISLQPFVYPVADINCCYSHAVPWWGSYYHAGVYLVSKKSLCKVQFLWSVYVWGALPSMDSCSHLYPVWRISVGWFSWWADTTHTFDNTSMYWA